MLKNMMMKFLEVTGFKNDIGYILGYASCPVTGDTYWRSVTYEVPFSQISSLRISGRALDVASSEQIAEAAFRTGGNGKGGGYTREDIMKHVDSGLKELYPAKPKSRN